MLETRRFNGKRQGKADVLQIVQELAREVLVCKGKTQRGVDNARDSVARGKKNRKFESSVKQNTLLYFSTLFSRAKRLGNSLTCTMTVAKFRRKRILKRATEGRPLKNNWKR